MDDLLRERIRVERMTQVFEAIHKEVNPETIWLVWEGNVAVFNRQGEHVRDVQGDLMAELAAYLKSAEDRNDVIGWKLEL